MWKDIKDYEGLYQINEFGDVRNAVTKEIRSPYITNKGYKAIDLNKNGTRKKFLIHRLVAMHFVPNPNNYPIVLHLDNVKLNTHYTNLKWGTYSENNAQCIRDGLNTVPRPDNRKYYEVYNNDGDSVICYGAQGVINMIGCGTDSIVRNLIFRQTPIRSGDYAGYRVKKPDTIRPFIIN